VLFLTQRLPYAANRGDRIRALHMLRHLRRSATIHLVSLVHDADEAQHIGDLRSLTATVTVGRVTRWRGYTRAVTALARRTPLTHALLDARGLQVACSRLVAEHRPDVVLACGSGMARFALEPPLREIPLVLDMVDVDSEKWSALGRTAAPPMRWVYANEARRLRSFEARAARASQAVLVVNDRERSSMADVEPTCHVVVVPNGVAADEFRAASAPSAERRVTFCGVMNYAPNEEGALWFARDVWPSIRNRYADARLSLVGSHPTASLHASADADATIEVTGAVPDVRPYLWRSAVAVAPLFVARGIQNKVLEAAAAGLPCVITQAVKDGLPAEVLPACLVAHDADTFAAGVIDLLGRAPEERRAMAQCANIRSLDWSERLRPLAGILERAAQRRRGGRMAASRMVTA